MNLAEATRQYQAAIEHRRRARTETADTVSLADELAGLDDDVRRAESVMYDAWIQA